MAYPYTAHAKKLYQIVNGAQRICGDYSGTGAVDGRTWKWEELVPLVNETVLDLVRRTWLLKETHAAIFKDWIQIYDLPANTLQLVRLGMHGVSGYVVMPVSITQTVLEGCDLAGSSFPARFFREYLDDNQFGVIPIGDPLTSIDYDSEYGLLRRLTDGTGNMIYDANLALRETGGVPVTINGTDYVIRRIGATGGSPTGSDTERDSDYGLLRQVSDGTDNLDYDANLALRRIAGVPFTRAGDGHIIREIVSTYGNLFITIVRAPKLLVNPDDYPDEGIPEWIHRDLKYGVALRMLAFTRRRKMPVNAARQQWFAERWQRVVRLIGRSNTSGEIAAGVRPM